VHEQHLEPVLELASFAAAHGVELLGQIVESSWSSRPARSSAGCCSVRQENPGRRGSGEPTSWPSFASLRSIATTTRVTYAAATVAGASSAVARSDEVSVALQACERGICLTQAMSSIRIDPGGQRSATGKTGALRASLTGAGTDGTHLTLVYTS
jgi:hypothetical protein